eukprot:COSAG01_NODE_4559_length_4922_cov_3.073813_1_plen_1390_part_10
MQACVKQGKLSEVKDLADEEDNTGQASTGTEEIDCTSAQGCLQAGYIKATVWIKAELRSLQQMTLAAKVIASVSPAMQRLLNFAHDWLSSLLPHCLAKVNRVTFGLLTPAEIKAALSKDANMPRSRLFLAVPFLGKDVPSQSSEFAHPDVIVGLTVLAYRYSGLRPADFGVVMDSLMTDFVNDIGPPEEREAFLRHAQWTLHSGGTVRGLARDGDGVSQNLPGLLAHLPEPDLAGQTDKLKRLEPSSGRWLSEPEFLSIYGLYKEWEAAAIDGIEVVQLKFFQRTNEDQMQNLYKLWAKAPRVIHRYLARSVFPEHMRSQRMKISASGQALGGEMLFGRRVGFSGTPSDLLPIELGQCDYESGDDGKMLSTVLDPAVMDCENLQEGWGVDDVLDCVSQMGGENPDRRFQALIDPGALITGYSNLQVAQELLERGLTWCDGVVFLDDDDRQQVLVRATWRVVPADQCGVPLATRFAFYDQIHTTGMDIKHVVNARAAITLGKDMVFRDYVQGAFRMRGIGRGQRITVFLIPEIRQLMARQLSDEQLGKNGAATAAVARASAQSTHEHTLRQIVAWLTINSMESEKVQWQMLCIQNTANIYRKNAFICLHGPHTLGAAQGTRADATLEMESAVSMSKCLSVFNEPIDFNLNAAVPEPVSLKDKLAAALDKHVDFVLTPAQHAAGQAILTEVGYYALLEGGGSGQRLETEQEREQEQEQQKEIQQQKDQEIEIEKFVDRDYSRNEEAPKPWPFTLLACSPSAFTHPGVVRSLRDSEMDAAEDAMRHDSASSDHGRTQIATEGNWCYRLRDFRLKQQASLCFPPYLGVSNNYYNRQWRGLRRLKNVVVVLEWAPSAGAIGPATPAPPVCPVDSEAVLKSAQMLARSSATADSDEEDLSSMSLNAEDLAAAIAELADRPATPDECAALLQRYGSPPAAGMSCAALHALVSSGHLHDEQSGRHFVVVSLAEAETIRRILHVRRGKCTIDGHDTEIALRYSPLSQGGDNSIAHGGAVLDVSSGWARRASGSVGHAETGVPAYQLAVAHGCLRFFDSDTHFSEPAVQVLVRALQWSEACARERFFMTTIGHRRRMECKWEETTLVRAVTLQNEWEALKQRAYSAWIRRCLAQRNLSLWAAFRAFDLDGDGLITGGELSGALRWLDVPARCCSPEDVVDFLEAVDIDRNGHIDYKEFMDELSLKSRHKQDDTEEAEVAADATAVPTLPQVAPEQAEAVREVMVRRIRQRQARARAEKLRQGAVKAALEKQTFNDELRRRDESFVGGSNPNVYEYTAGEEAAAGQPARVQVTEFHFSCGSLPLRAHCNGSCTFKTMGRRLDPNSSPDTFKAPSSADVLSQSSFGSTAMSPSSFGSVPTGGFGAGPSSGLFGASAAVTAFG